MYTPRHFASPSDHDVTALVCAYPFCVLITTQGDEAPQITHLPLLWNAGGEHGVLEGHMARANPHWQAFAQGRTVAVFNGPHAYISPNWYAQPQREVPTWNYAAVHAHGVPQLLETRAEKCALLDRSTAVFESDNSEPWTRQIEGPTLDAKLDHIVAFRLPIERLEAKFKLNQNKTAADRARVIGQLRASAHPDLQTMARWMQTHEPD
ncbi:FMN-binding negative transcriptional regulator [Sinimarinibacterium sp. CAU 1509]|uniref:FMN-binding negative transcriptional regulator n=1 Tax=Sinimarinibacterium sp. CAU 1509 TaxID=2562283 RepID=UPI0010ACA1A3|nr:FMN-binding negative transcriptional regulator [Sinimarinibacterium sp. CAU 1509]TJY63211.1 FMN-binding negative transcriptional regulator [Sinimarinibacterium sp. CAU 1509]